MHVVWLRPDGFHGATPNDYSVFELKGAGRLWLHRTDKDRYPFRVSGGWEDESASIKLNNLVNLIPCSDEDWVQGLQTAFSHSMGDDRKKYFRELTDWVDELMDHLKGDSWEVDILRQALLDVQSRLAGVEGRFTD